VAEGQHFFNSYFFASAFGNAGQMWPKAHIFSIRFVLRRPSATPDRCGRRPTYFQFVFLPVGLRQRRTDVAEGTHFFNSYFFASTFGQAVQMWPKANIYSTDLLAQAFGHAGQMWPKAHIYSTDFLASAFGHAGQMWPKANIF
jgi:hypothetical protein